jgi:hypothetical protein
MKHSRVFHTDEYIRIEKDIVSMMNLHKDFMSETTAASPRASGDAIQSILADSFDEILGDLCGSYSAQFARRAMADIAFTDRDGLYYVVDVKTHRLDTHFNMPNLTSVERLARFYEDDNNFFVVLSLAYTVAGTRLRIENVHFVPIEFLSWDCLTIGALGWGQIQIANSNNIVVQSKYSRKKWMIEFCRVMLDFYPKEIGKIESRVNHFEKVKKHWENKAE